MAYLGASGEFAVWFVTTIMAVLVGLRIVSRVKLAPNTASWEDLVIVLAGVMSHDDSPLAFLISAPITDTGAETGS